MPFLKVDNVTHQFGGLRAVHDYELSIEVGQICGLIRTQRGGQDHDLQPDHRHL